jgi:hypothetical protein
MILETWIFQIEDNLVISHPRIIWAGLGHTSLPKKRCLPKLLREYFKKYNLLLVIFFIEADYPYEEGTACASQFLNTSEARTE